VHRGKRTRITEASIGQVKMPIYLMGMKGLPGGRRFVSQSATKQNPTTLTDLINVDSLVSPPPIGIRIRTATDGPRF